MVSSKKGEINLGRVIPSQQWQIRAIQLLSVVGLLLAYFLKLYHDEMLFVQCGDGSQKIFGLPIDCGLVSGPTSTWSSLKLLGFEIPIAEMGLLAYAGIFGSIWLADIVAPLRRFVKPVLMLMTAVGFAFTLYLTYLEAFEIKAWCKYCLYSAGIILTMFLLSLSMYAGNRRNKL